MRLVTRVWLFSLTTGFITLCLGCASAFEAKNEQGASAIWTKEKDDNGESPYDWEIFSREKQGASVREFMIVGELNVSPAMAVKASRHRTEHSELYLSGEEGFINVLQSSETEMLVYSVYRLPLFFKDREMCERFVVSADESSGVHKISWKEHWTDCPPPDEDLVRMNLARGTWEFQPLGPDRSRATFIVHADLAGSLPAFLNDVIVLSGLPDEFEKLESAAKILQNRI